jgi:SAM-dependent methyltransferase
MAEGETIWERGDYGVVGDWFADASRACLDGLELSGKRVLDVACGTGAVAIEAARRGAEVVGVDITPKMLDEARHRADAAGVEVDFRLGSFDDLSAYSGFDVVGSAFGVIFADDPTAVCAQVHGALAPGGVATLSAWARGGAFGGPPPALLELIPQLVNAPDRVRFGDPVTFDAILAPTPAERTHFALAQVHAPFASLDDLFDQLVTYSGPWAAAFESFEDAGFRARVEEIMRAHLGEFVTERDGGVSLALDYAVGRFA